MDLKQRIMQEPAMEAMDRRPHRDPQSEVGAGRDGLASFAKCFAECDFARRHVRLYRCGNCPRRDFDY